MSEGEEKLEIPDLFMASYSVEGEDNHGGGTTYVTLREDEDSVLLAEFGIVSETGYIGRVDGEWNFEAAIDERGKDDIDKPPVRRIFRNDKEALREELQTEEYVYGSAIREAWENWSEGDGFYLRIDGDEREFEADHQRLMNYDRRDRH